MLFLKSLLYTISVKCDEATVPANGSVVIETDGILTTARYSCDVGYSVPDSHLQPVACQSDGSWESQAPICCKYSKHR